MFYIFLPTWEMFFRRDVSENTLSGGISRISFSVKATFYSGQSISVVQSIFCLILSQRGVQYDPAYDAAKQP